MMARVTCSYCGHKVKLPQSVVLAIIRCPGCAQLFYARVQAQTPPEQVPQAGRSTANQAVPPPRSPRRQTPTSSPVAGPSPAPTALLAPSHQCQHCGSPIESPVGRPAATVDCPACHNKTSVYAVLHCCVSCHRLLESPSRLAGTEVSCPACQHVLSIPQDVLLKEPPSHPDDFWFGFYCLACSGEVVTRKKDVGTYAVCPHCLVPCVVPHAGHYLGGAEPAPTHEPLDSLHPSKEVACPQCGTRFPVRASACPVCGARPPSPSPW